MKRYEKMSKEEIIAIIDSAQGCRNCFIKKECSQIEASGCCETVSKWLNEEIEMIPRAWTFRSLEEVEKAWIKFKEENGCIAFSNKCKSCKFNHYKHGCYMYWLYGEVEK